MSQTSKIVLGIAIAAIALLGGFYYWNATHTETVGQESAEEKTSLPSGDNTQDSAIEQDFSAVDTQLSGVQSDNADVGASVSAAAAQ